MTLYVDSLLLLITQITINPGQKPKKLWGHLLHTVVNPLVSLEDRDTQDLSKIIWALAVLDLNPTTLGCCPARRRPQE
jgi:hypothetical protein